MPHFAVVAPPLKGHFQPLSHLAGELLSRGHSVTFIHQRDAACLVEAAGARFEAIGANSPALSGWTAPMARIRGALGLGSVMDGMVRLTDMICRDAPAVIERIGADALIVDQLEPGGGLVAEHLGLPFVSVASALPVNREDGIPPPYVGWPYDPTGRGLSRNRGGWRVSDFLMRRVYAAIERNARRLSLPPRRRIEECFSPLLQLSQMVRSIDFPRSELPASFQYCGPFRGAAQEQFDLPEGDGRPLVYCTLGTLQGSRTALFRKVAEACAALNLRLLISHGRAGKMDHDLPGDPLIYDWVPQQAVLRHADLVICHGGMNTVLDSLAAGVPLATVPLAFEQAATAARLEFAGVGRTVLSRSPTAQIGDAIAQVRSAPTYLQKALAVQREICNAGGAARAADLIEQSIGAVARRAAATTAPTGQDGARGDSRNGNS